MAFDSREFRTALGNFATGVTIVTARSRSGEPLGLTANSFNSVSLDPPLVLFSLNRQAYSLKSFEEAGNFAINVLRDDQQDISQVFAQAATDKWQGPRLRNLGERRADLLSCACGLRLRDPCRA